MSIEYMNLALGLVIYSVRYPALFWSTNKCLGLIFSFQLLINGLHTLISFAGMSILYKVRSCSHRYEKNRQLAHSLRLPLGFLFASGATRVCET